MLSHDQTQNGIDMLHQRIVNIKNHPIYFLTNIEKQFYSIFWDFFLGPKMKIFRSHRVKKFCKRELKHRANEIHSMIVSTNITRKN